MGNTKPSFVVPAGVDTALKTAVDPFEMNIFYIGALIGPQIKTEFCGL
jgi:hypothetical protein